MKIELEPGCYVLAVSGGVDSMVLLDLAVNLAKSKKQNGKRSQKSRHFRFIVAHFDHGIREDSEQDRLLVARAAKHYSLPFVFDEARLLGPKASEATARKARYDFLRRVKRASGADAIVTAHHQDDVIETAILNLLRGTGRKGLSSLADTSMLRRPMLDFSKKQLRAYAKRHDLTWREDSTNKDLTYRRNYIRERIVAKMNQADRLRLLDLLARTKQTNQVLDDQIAKFLQFVSKETGLDRKLFISLPHKVAMEVMAAWLRRHEIRQFDKKLLERLVTAGKALAPGKQTDVERDYYLSVHKDRLELKRRP